MPCVRPGLRFETMRFQRLPNESFKNDQAAERLSSGGNVVIFQETQNNLELKLGI
jgi:hypothetical protein